MTTRTVKLGGTDWTAEILTYADLNDTIDALTIKERYTDQLTTTGTSTSTSFETKWTVDVSGETTLYAYNIFYFVVLRIAAVGSTRNCQGQLLITFDDDSTDTVALLTVETSIGTTAYKSTINSYNAAKRIKQIEVQIKTSDAGSTAAVVESDTVGSRGEIPGSYMTLG